MLPEVTIITSSINLKWIDQLRYYMENLVKTPYNWFVVDNMTDPIEHFSVANNFAAEDITTPYILFLNDDIRPLCDFLAPMLETIKEKPNIGLVGAKLYFPDGRIQHAGIGFKRGADGRGMVGHMGYEDKDRPLYGTKNYCPVTFACALTKTDLFREVGGLSEVYKSGFEDVDYNFKLLSRQWECIYEPRARLIHYQWGSRRLINDRDNWELCSGRWGREIEMFTRMGEQ